MTEQNDKPKTTTIQKTLRQKVEVRAGLDVWYRESKDLYNRVVSFYFDLYQSHPLLLELPSLDALSEVERLTHRTARNPQPFSPLDVVVTEDIPALLRRVAINQARGAYQSFRSNLSRWEREKVAFESKPSKQGKPRIFQKRPPVPPRAFNFNPSFYDGMYKERSECAVVVKLWSGHAWQWVKVSMSECSHPADCQFGSPILVELRGKFWLHTPVSWEIKKPLKLVEQIKENLSFRTCSVDLNLDGCAAVCTILNSDGTPAATKFVTRSKGLDDRRKRLLGTIATKRRKTGIIAKGEQDNARLWQKIRDIDENEAHRISRCIVDFAHEWSASVIVFEHLTKLRPDKQRYSRRTNAKRTYWLKGKIFQYTKYKAWGVGIITSRVNPRNTSRLCPKCKGHVARYRSGQAPIDYTPGTPLVLCPSCLHRGNADRSAAINIGHKFLDRYHPGQFWPLPEKPPSRKKKA